MSANSKPGIERRTFLKAGAAGLAAPMFYIRGAWAQNKSINVGTYMGVQGEYIRKNVIPKFEADYGCRVFQSEGVTLGQIAILRTQKANPTYSVMFMDDVGIPIAKSEDLIKEFPQGEMKNLSKINPRFIMNDGFGAAFAVFPVAPIYNSTIATPPQTWADLWDPRFKGRFMLTSAKQTQSIMLVIAAASLATGKPFAEAQYNLDAAWAKLAELKPNVQTSYENAQTALLQLAQGQADVLGPDSQKIVLPFAAKGAPVAMALPKEGAFLGINCVTLVKNGPNPDLAAAFADRLFEPSIQKGLAEIGYSAPTVAGLDLSPEALKYLAYPEARLTEMKLLAPDWSYLNPIRSAIIEKWNQTFGV
jgi:putative spermidine/putrescine transport system substrate-binding protein